jgi:NADH:ubiquinone oxidoreductase subunit F (NADH-binding)
MARRRLLLDGEPVRSLDEHRARGGGEALDLASRLGPDGVLDELEISGLRGRGGAGFPAAIKWRTIAAGADGVGERFVVANGAEGEPGTFKDRTLMVHDPYSVVEGVLIAARTVGARRAFVATKASFAPQLEALARAIDEIRAAGWAEGVELTLVPGPDEYLFGEEKGLLEVIEGEEPLPRMFPPYVYGLFTMNPQMGWSAGAGRVARDSTDVASNPTLVNNVETLATVPHIVRRGGEWYRSIGTPESPGTVICTVSGDTVHHGVDEFELGTPLEEVLVELGGGLPEGRAVRYVLSGVANPVVRGPDLGVPVSYEGMESIGSGLGSAGFVVYDDRTDPLELATAVSRFLGVESCGQCPACKLGCTEITEMLADAGEGGYGPGDLAALDARLDRVTDAARCFLPSQEQRVIRSLLPDLRDPTAREGTVRRDLLVAEIHALRDGRVELDERQARKRPDWTYDPA